MRAASPGPVAAVAGILFLAALAPRLANLDQAFQNGVPLFPPFDDLYHAKRILHSALNFPHVLELDPGRGAAGAFCPWPPLYDLVLGGLARLFAGRDPQSILRTASFFPPILSSLGVAALGGLLTARLGIVSGLLGGFALAASSTLIAVGRLSALDHHDVEGFLFAGVVLAVLALPSPAGPPGPPPWRRGLLLAGVLLVALFVQTAFLSVAGVLVAATLLLLLADRPAAWAVAISLGVTGAVVLAWGLSRGPSYPVSQWYLGVPHATALFAGAAAVAIALLLTGRGLRPLFAAGLGGLTAALLALAVPGTAESFFGGAHFLAGDPWLSRIQEFRPLYVESPTALLAMAVGIGGGALLVPLFAAWCFRKGSLSDRLLAFFAIAFFCASVLSRRFVAFSLPVFALAAATLLGRLLSEKRTLAALGAGLVLAGPAALTFGLSLRSTPPVVPPEARPMFRAAAVLRPGRGEVRPARVLGPWSWGHLLAVTGGRPVLIDNFGSSVAPGAFEEGLSILLEREDERVAAFCRARGVGFIVLENPLPRAFNTAGMLGRPTEAYYVQPPGSPQGPRPRELLRQTFWFRHYFGSGSGAFRRLYEDPARAGEMPEFDGPAVVVLALVESEGEPESVP